MSTANLPENDWIRSPQKTLNGQVAFRGAVLGCQATDSLCHQ